MTARDDYLELWAFATATTQAACALDEIDVLRKEVTALRKLYLDRAHELDRYTVRFGVLSEEPV